MAKKKKKNNFFERFANAATKFTGSSWAFIGASLIVVVWAATGPLFGFSEVWQLVINTGTTIITFLMVFLIQKAQNKDGKAIQLKLNELIAANRFASNRMVDIEDLSEDELDQLHKFYVKLSDLAEKDDDIHKSHSIDAALNSNAQKSRTRGVAVKTKSTVPQNAKPENGIKPDAPKRRKPTRKKPLAKPADKNEDNSTKG